MGDQEEKGGRGLGPGRLRFVGLEREIRFLTESRVEGGVLVKEG